MVDRGEKPGAQQISQAFERDESHLIGFPR
jgi:hypothetical protein